MTFLTTFTTENFGRPRYEVLILQFYVCYHTAWNTGRDLHERDPVHHPRGVLPHRHLLNDQSLSTSLLQVGSQH